MAKIQKVIETCYDCEFCKKFLGGTGGSIKAHLCVYYPADEEKEFTPFLVDYCTNGSNEIPIPDNCPLEDYKPKTEC